MGRLTFLAVVIEACLIVHALPIVDPGLFVIMGVQSCRDGKGYCLLGQDCSLDNDFLSDDQGGHCDGLRTAFTPSAPFVCCRFSGDATTTEISPTTTDTSLDIDGTTMLPLNDQKRSEGRMNPKITTKRSYDVYEEPSEMHSSEKDPRGKLNRLEDTNKENDEPFHVELPVDELKNYNKNLSSLRIENGLDNEAEMYKENTTGLTDTQSTRNNNTVPRGNMSAEPTVCVPKPRKLEERGPLTFSRCEPFSSTTLSIVKEGDYTASPRSDMDNQVDRPDGANGTKGSSKSQAELSTELIVDSNTGITELEINDVVGSVTTRDGLSALERSDTANGTSFLSKDYNMHNMRSYNNSDVHFIVNNVYKTVSSFNTSSTKNTSESTTVMIEEQTTTTDDDPVNSSVMHDTTTEYVSEYEVDNDYVDDTSTTVMDKGFTSAKYLEDENHSTEGSTLTQTTTTSAFDQVSTMLAEVTQALTVESTDSTTLTTQDKTQGTESPISTTTESTTDSSHSVEISSPIMSPASSTAPLSKISAIESSTENNEKETTDSITEQSYTSTPKSNTETKETITSTPAYKEKFTDAFSDNITTASADISTTNRDKANVSVCIGGNQVTSRDDCWLLQFRDSRSNITICPGALLTTNMVITSASCVIRLFNVGMEYIKVMHADGSLTSQRLRDIIVHENYRPARSRPPRYDMGVIHLTPSEQRRQKACVVCVAEPKMDVKVQRCHVAVRYTTQGEADAQRECKNSTPSGRRLGSVMTVCSKTSPSTPKVPSGSPLICNGMLAGVAMSWDREQAFTPINLFTTWIKNNQ